MGLFQHKKPATQQSPEEEALELEQHFFDENFREELRNHGRLYFEKVINQNADLFKKDLDNTVAQVNTELKDHIAKQLDAAIVEVNNDLKEHVTKRLDDQLAEYSKTLKEAQDTALASLTKSTQALQDQQKELSTTLQKTITDQQALLSSVFDESKSKIKTMNDSQASALQWLAQSAQAMQEQYQQMSTILQKNITEQQDMLISSFETNMARVVEHYLLGALGDQYDLKAQLPSIIQQMETNKQAIVDDMKLWPRH